MTKDLYPTEKILSNYIKYISGIELGNLIERPLVQLLVIKNMLMLLVPLDTKEAAGKKLITRYIDLAIDHKENLPC